MTKFNEITTELLKYNIQFLELESIRNEKTKAVQTHKYEQAYQLRDIEKDLVEKLEIKERLSEIKEFLSQEKISFFSNFKRKFYWFLHHKKPNSLSIFFKLELSIAAFMLLKNCFIYLKIEDLKPLTNEKNKSYKNAEAAEINIEIEKLYSKLLSEENIYNLEDKLKK